MELRFCVIIFAFFAVCFGEKQSSSCTTPNGEKALCQSLLTCSVILKATTSQDPTALKFFEASKCGDFMVCCGTFGNYTEQPPQLEQRISPEQNETKESHRDFVLRKLLPTTRFCGLQHTDDYEHNYTKTSVDEFPWLIHMSLINNTNTLDYGNAGGEPRCVGAIISPRYALTDGDCYTHWHYPNFHWVRIGLYNRHKTSDCIKTSFGVDDCTEPSILVGVEEKLKSDTGILLIRFVENIQYSDFVRPICLPLNQTNRAKVGDTVLTSGWGTNDFRTVQDFYIKKKVEHTIISSQANKSLISVNNSNDYNACFGDQGGPVMYKFKNQWFLEGIVPDSFCHVDAFKPITPDTVNWILDNMRS